MLSLSSTPCNNKFMKVILGRVKLNGNSCLPIGRLGPLNGVISWLKYVSVALKVSVSVLVFKLVAKYFNFQPTCVNNRINKGNELTEQFLLNCFYKNRTSMHQNFEFVSRNVGPKPIGKCPWGLRLHSDKVSLKMAFHCSRYGREKHPSAGVGRETVRRLSLRRGVGRPLRLPGGRWV